MSIDTSKLGTTVREGYEDFQRGLRSLQNPHPDRSFEFHQWHLGWEMAQRESDEITEPVVQVNTIQGIEHVTFYCFSCGKLHTFAARRAQETVPTSFLHPSWEWNGSLTHPTVPHACRCIQITYPDGHYCGSYIEDGLRIEAYDAIGGWQPLRPVKDWPVLLKAAKKLEAIARAGMRPIPFGPTEY